MKIDGGCHCGNITYEAEVDPERVSICHCTDCQQLTGSAFRTSIPVPDHAFKLSGEKSSSGSRLASSSASVRHATANSSCETLLSPF